MLHYYGPEYGYVDSNDRAEIAAIVRERNEQTIARRVEVRAGRELMYHEAMALRYARNAVDRFAKRAELRRSGYRLTIGGAPGARFLTLTRNR